MLGMVVMCLASQCELMRAAAYETLSLVYDRLQSASFFGDVQVRRHQSQQNKFAFICVQIQTLLMLLRNAIEHENQLISTPICTFVARAARVLLRPETGSIYKHINKVSPLYVLDFFVTLSLPRSFC